MEAVADLGFSKEGAENFFKFFVTKNHKGDPCEFSQLPREARKFFFIRGDPYHFLYPPPCAPQARGYLKSHRFFCPPWKPARGHLQFDPFGTFRVSLESLWSQLLKSLSACELLQDVEQKRPREDRRHV